MQNGVIIAAIAITNNGDTINIAGGRYPCGKNVRVNISSLFEADRCGAEGMLV